MSKLKRISIISIIWNLILLALLFFQSRVLMKIINDKLFISDDIVKNVVEGNLVELLKSRVIETATIIGVLIIIQLIVFFVVNFIFYKKIKSMDKKEAKNLSKYYKYILIYMLVFIIVFLAFSAFSGMKISKLAEEMNFSVDRGSILVVAGIISDIRTQGAPELKKFISDVLEVFSDSADIKTFLSTVFSKPDGRIFIKNAWYLIGYLLIAYGIFSSVRLFALSNKQVQ